MSKEMRESILEGLPFGLTPELAREAVERYGSLGRAAEALGYSRTHLRRLVREDTPSAKVLCPNCGHEIGVMYQSGRIQPTDALVRSIQQ